MFTDTGQLVFNHYFGIDTCAWQLTAKTNGLVLFADKKDDTEHILHYQLDLTVQQAEEIRQLSGITHSIMLDILFEGHPLQLMLVGKRTAHNVWSGHAALYDNTCAVSRLLQHGITFAEQIVSEVSSVIVVLNNEGKIQRFNRHAEELTGLKECDVIGKNAAQLFMLPEEQIHSKQHLNHFFHHHAAYTTERHIKTLRGERLFLFHNKLLKIDNKPQNLFLICSGIDITDERKAQDSLRQLTNTDIVTGLDNRHAIYHKLTTALQMRQHNENIGVIYLDLDNFKQANDVYGHIFGDKLLIAVAQALRNCLPNNCTLARLGGDEFIILAHATTSDALEHISQRIIERFSTPFYIDGTEIYAACSLGIALCPEHTEELEALVCMADTAMYLSKNKGKNTYTLFEHWMNNQASESLWLDTHLRNSLIYNQLEIYYQPKISTYSGKVVATEALVRWHAPGRGILNPKDFIPYAEKSGLIIPLGKWVIENTVKQVAEWKKKGIILRTAINISARQLTDFSLFDTFLYALYCHNIDAYCFDFELTESCLFENEETALQLIKRLRLIGTQIHLDDFGTGYSSLSKLATIPIDAIKLDRHFIGQINKNLVSQSLVHAMLSVATALNFNIIAEGIETPEEDAYISRIGINEKQGFYYAPPMPVHEFEEWVINYNQIEQRTT